MSPLVPASSFQLLFLVSFGTSSCAGVLRLSQVHFSERISAKAQSRRRPPAAKQGSAKTCKSQTCPCHSPSPSILGSLRLSVSPRSHSAILKKKKNRCNLRLATPFFFGSSPRTVCRRSLIETVCVVGYPPRSVLFPTQFSSLSLFASTSLRAPQHIRSRHSLPHPTTPRRISPQTTSN